MGTEVKAAKDGKMQLKDAYAAVIGNEAWLVNAHISQYSHGNRENHVPVHNRKLLLHRREIDKLLGQTREKGLAADPHQGLPEERAHQVRAGAGQRQETARQTRGRTRPHGRSRGKGRDAEKGVNRLGRVAFGYKSSGRKPVCSEISFSMTGPNSSLSWKAKRYCGQPSRRSVR